VSHYLISWHGNARHVCGFCCFCLIVGSSTIVGRMATFKAAQRMEEHAAKLQVTFKYKQIIAILYFFIFLFF
jgi:hypothetical protein